MITSDNSSMDQAYAKAIQNYEPKLVRKWVSKIDGNGEEEFLDVEKTSDGGYIAVGYTTSTNIRGLTNKGSADCLIAKYDANGNEQWKKSVGGSKYDWYNSVIEITDGTYIAVGTILSTDVVDKNGNNIGHGYNFNCLFSNNYVVAMEGIIGRYDLNGNEISLNTTGKANTTMNIVIKGIDKMSDGNYIITGKKIVQGNDDGNMEDYLGSGTAIKYNLQGQEITECSTALYTSEYYGLGGSIAPSNYKDIHLQMTIWNGVIENNTSGYTFYGGSFSWAGGASIWKTTSTLENVMLRK